MIFSVVLFAVGMALSAFFSGSETGFYRLNRARLVIHALDGDRICRGLLWAVRNPSLFVATALVGNNVANYITSAAIVMAAAAFLPSWPLAELVAPMLFAPFIFIYGELLPKQLFLAAPNRLLRVCAPAFGVAATLFAPVSAVLWLSNKLLEVIGRRSPDEVRMVLARRELSQLLDEGEAVGLLRRTQ
ncbi:MAG: CNNM domain-containing protein, partial [Aeoliella sp.]